MTKEDFIKANDIHGRISFYEKQIQILEQYLKTENIDLEIKDRFDAITPIPLDAEEWLPIVEKKMKFVKDQITELTEQFEKL